MKIVFFILLINCQAFMCRRNPVDLECERCSEEFLSVLNTIEKALDKISVPGMVLSVVQDIGESDEYWTWSKGFGLARLDQKVPVDGGKTKFAIGSISKSFCASLIAILLSEQSERYPRKWNTKLLDIMGSDFELPTLIRKDYTTLKDVLAHRVGLHLNTPLILMGLNSTKSSEDYCRRMGLLKEYGEFRSDYTYSNIMFLLAGRIAEVLGNDSLTNLMKKKIFLPLEMHNTVMIGEMDIKKISNIATMYFKNISNQLVFPMDDDLLRTVEYLPSAGGVLSTGEDMLKWMMFHLSRGKDEEGRTLIDEDLWKEMHTKQMLKASFSENNRWEPVLADVDGVGIGWFMGYYRENKLSEHGGRIGGFDSKLTLMPGKKFGIFSSANGPAYHSYPIQIAIHYMIYDILNNETLWLDAQRLSSYPHESINANSSTSRKPFQPPKGIPVHPESYVGIYGNQLFGNFTVVESKGPQSIKFSYGSIGRGTLEFLNETFSCVSYEGALKHLHWTMSQSAYYFNVTFAKKDRNNVYQELIVAGSSNYSASFLRYMRWDPFVQDRETLNSAATKMMKHFLHLIVINAFGIFIVVTFDLMI